MSIQQSNLASTGFDYVVAVSQDSINATLEEYLYKGLKETILCYVYDNQNNPTPIDFATFVASANNTDPFTVPDGTPQNDPQVQNLNNANFAFAIKAKLGLPPGIKPDKLPPIITLKSGQSYATYTLMFSEFVATELIFGPRGKVTWMNQSQPYGTSWTLSGAVDLNFQDENFAKLPPAIQNRLKDIGDPDLFGVQQLYYDLNNSGLEQSFQVNGPSNSPLSGFMANNFVSTYWKALGGNELLGYAVKQRSSTAPSSLAVTNLNFFTPNAAGLKADPLTLNYLCAINNNPLPDTTHAGFGWNWLEADEVSKYDGVAALNRNTFAPYLNNARFKDGRSLYDYVSSNCYLPSVKVTYKGGIELKVEYKWSMTPRQTPTVNYPATGSTILSYSYSSGTVSDQAGLNGDAGRMQLSSSFDLSVSVQGNQMVIVQHLVIWCDTKYLATDASGNIVDIQITDTYEFGIDTKGQIIVSTPNSGWVNNSKIPGANDFLNFWADVNTLAADVAQWSQQCVATSLTDVPVSNIQNFVFPGGSTFSFATVCFSDNQDLVAHITYADV